MPDQNAKRIVLKFGGSVLIDEEKLRIAVHEIYRWRRDGWQVIAVVSALAGRTEELIARCNRLHPTTSPTAKATLIGQGERESAALLGVHLDRAGIPAQVLMPESLSLIATGDPLDAVPISLERDTIDKALACNGVVVIPGFVAINETGETVTLGRGGSDLTAVFMKGETNATRCRLIKDVDALYASDPASCDILPPRYAYASYEAALETDGSIIQHKAVRYAERFGLEFELGRFNATRPTTIGPGPTQCDGTPDTPICLTVALCGLGAVGEGVADLLYQLPDHFRITGAARKHLTDKDLDRPYTVVDDAIRIATSGADVVIELIGGNEIARDVSLSAIKNGSHLVSANKALLAQDRHELERLAKLHNTSIRASASVGGTAPVLEALRTTPVTAVEGILNGTGNYVLDQLEKGHPLDGAINSAKLNGFAEADPSRDLDGRDALDKLSVIAQELGWQISDNAIHRSSIVNWASSTKSTYPARHIAFIDSQNARVIVEPVEQTSQLAQTKDEWNIAFLHHPDGSTTSVRGKGAGRWPTSEAVLADLLEISRQKSHHAAKELCHAQ